MNVVFLDYDGVVNTPRWKKRDGEWYCSFNYPENGRVNDSQSVQWVSEFCEKYNYVIVVTSTWRFSKNYKECLYKAALRDSVRILGKTPRISNGCRGDEITEWLVHQKGIKNFLIFDDDGDMGDLKDHLVKCDTNHGFKLTEFNEAVRLHKKFEKENQH